LSFGWRFGTPQKRIVWIAWCRMLSVLGRTIVPSFPFFALYYRETFAMRRWTETERNENETSQASLLTLPNLLAFAFFTIFSQVMHGRTCIYTSVEVVTMDAWAAWPSPPTRRRLQSLLRIAPTSLQDHTTCKSITRYRSSQRFALSISSANNLHHATNPSAPVFSGGTPTPPWSTSLSAA
jgi:hypothetical protein